MPQPQVPPGYLHTLGIGGKHYPRAGIIGNAAESLAQNALPAAHLREKRGLRPGDFGKQLHIFGHRFNILVSE